MTQRQDPTSKCKSGKSPTIQAGFIYTKAGRFSVSPLLLASCDKCNYRQVAKIRHSKQAISVEGRETIANRLNPTCFHRLSPFLAHRSSFQITQSKDGWLLNKSTRKRNFEPVLDYCGTRHSP
jgi:hypothetical protein